MFLLEAILFLVVMAGHLGVWCTLFNQVHATSWPRWIRKGSEKIIFVMVALILILLSLQVPGQIEEQSWMPVYRWLCIVVFAALTIRWAYRKLMWTKPVELVTEEGQMVNLASRMSLPRLSGLQARLLGMVPGNQTLKLSIERREIRLDRWPVELDGMVIAHLTDLHFTGKVSRSYFEKMTQECNACLPDFVFVTGDIVDKQECLEWLPETLGRLESRYGKYFVLGNHDLRIRDEARLVRALEACGFQRALPSWRTIQFGDGEFSLAGDELPWFTGAEELTTASSPSILLSHSPDRIYNANRLGVDLVLAGHCHGGQIRLPLVGPIVAPSKYGVRFASGTFKVGQSLMHVSKGISGDDPIRWNCPPELNVIKVRCLQNADANETDSAQRDQSLQGISAD